ncbi:hypothetical protein, partial [Kingella oralis]|uniref:hypothetical protein n=1 Tax=Kingella oralis TaxID=505 RepID=UPI003C6F67A0
MPHRLQSLPRFQAASYTQGSLKIKSAYPIAHLYRQIPPSAIQGKPRIHNPSPKPQKQPEN